MSGSSDRSPSLAGSGASDEGRDDETLVLAGHGPQPAPVDVGQQIGRYVVLGEVGRGAMGRVLRAYDPKLQREVALKELQLHSGTPHSSRAALVAEARAMAKLSHPNVVSVFDVEEAQDGDHTRLLLVMEYVDGVTLRDWLATERPWQEVLDRFVQAGRGLAAAHAAGLLHRDFKPANVMEGGGDVKVTDFGLAVAGRSPTSGGSAPQENVQTESAVMGTPRYMAPEQHAGRRDLGPAIDQYAFCVALWEALVSEPPFPNHAIVKAKFAGPPAWPRNDVPRWLASALERGLQPNPARRFGSMEALLSALTVAPARARNRWMLAGGGLVAGAVLAVAATTGRAEPPCRGAADKLEGVWDPVVRDEVQTAIADTRAAWADTAWTRTSTVLDDYASQWVAMHVEACEATSVRKEQSEAVMDLRMACLQGAHTELQAVTEVLRSADLDLVEHISNLLDSLPDLARCSDIRALQDGVPPPSPQEKDEVDRVRSLLAHAKAQRNAGRFEPARVAAVEAETLASSLSYGPLDTEVQFEMGQVLESLGEFEESAARLQRTLGFAAEHRQLRLLESAASDLMMLLGYRLQRPDEALRYKEIVEGLAKGHPQREATLHSMLGSIADRQGRYADAAAEYRKALELERGVHDGPHARVADFRGNLALALSRQGDFAAAEAEFRAVQDVFEATLGPEHPDVATVRNNLAGTLLDQGRHAEAVEEFRGSLEHRQRVLGPDHRLVAQSQANLASALRAVGELEEAETLQRQSLETLERKFGPDDPDLPVGLNGLAIILSEKGDNTQAAEVFNDVLQRRLKLHGPKHPSVGQARTNLGSILRTLGDLEGARAQLQQARTIFEASLGTEHPLVATVLVELAHLEAARSQTQSAETLLSTAVSIRMSVFGADHAETVSARQSLETLQTTGSLAE